MVLQYNPKKMKKYFVSVLGILISFILTAFILVPLYKYVQALFSLESNYFYLTIGVIDSLVLGFLAIGLFRYFKFSLIGLTVYIGYALASLFYMYPASSVVVINELRNSILYLSLGIALTLALKLNLKTAYLIVLINTLFILAYNAVVAFPVLGLFI